MKKLIYLTLLILVVKPAYAFDTWSVEDYNGEKVYSAGGNYHKILIGERGVGYNTAFSDSDLNEPVIVRVDDGPAETYELKTLGRWGSLKLLENSNKLSNRMKSAKKIVFIRRSCHTPYCHFSLTGGNDGKIEWDFEVPLEQLIQQTQTSRN